MARLTKSDLFLLPLNAATRPRAAPRIASCLQGDTQLPALAAGALVERQAPKEQLAVRAHLAPAKGVSEPLNAKLSGAQAAASSLRFELARALPSLWAKAQRDFADGRSDREKEKLRELILWLLSKKCADVRQRQTVNFQHEGRRTSGRIDVVAYPKTGSALALEMDWAYARKSLEKLKAAQELGWDVMWVCGARMDKAAAKALRTRADLEFGLTFRWLYMFHLEHGWL